jgi:hypothetical protein
MSTENPCDLYILQETQLIPTSEKPIKVLVTSWTQAVIGQDTDDIAIETHATHTDPISEQDEFLLRIEEIGKILWSVGKDRPIVIHTNDPKLHELISKNQVNFYPAWEAVSKDTNITSRLEMVTTTPGLSAAESIGNMYKQVLISVPALEQ